MLINNQILSIFNQPLFTIVTIIAVTKHFTVSIAIPGSPNQWQTIAGSAPRAATRSHAQPKGVLSLATAIHGQNRQTRQQCCLWMLSVPSRNGRVRILSKDRRRSLGELGHIGNSWHAIEWVAMALKTNLDKTEVGSPAPKNATPLWQFLFGSSAWLLATPCRLFQSPRKNKIKVCQVETYFKITTSPETRGLSLESPSHHSPGSRLPACPRAAQPVAAVTLETSFPCGLCHASVVDVGRSQGKAWRWRGAPGA